MVTVQRQKTLLVNTSTQEFKFKQTQNVYYFITIFTSNNNNNNDNNNNKTSLLLNIDNVIKFDSLNEMCMLN